MTAYAPLDYGRSNAAPRVWFERTTHDYTDWEVVRDAMRFTHDAANRTVRAPLVAALYAADDTIIKRVIGALLDYHSTPQGSFEELNGPDNLANVAETLSDAAEAVAELSRAMREAHKAARMEERE